MILFLPDALLKSPISVTLAVQGVGWTPALIFGTCGIRTNPESFYGDGG